jgi:hypothetical protein
MVVHGTSMAHFVSRTPPNPGGFRRLTADGRPIGELPERARSVVPAQSGSIVSRVSPGAFRKMPSWATSGMPSQMAVAATQRSASWSR